jgi:hemolysin III
MLSSFFSKFREPVSGLTHFFAALAALAGLVVLLVVGWGQIGKTISLAVYGASLVLLFAASASYHLVKARPEVVQALRKFDHSAIYLLIAGTYTPICFNMFSGFWQWGMLAIVWGLALVGIGVKTFIINTPRWLTALIYILMGWLCILAIGEMLVRMPPWALFWLTAGGIIYTLGALVYATKALNFFPGVFGFHEVWHIFVILGALAHYISILFFVAPVG